MLHKTIVSSSCAYFGCEINAYNSFSPSSVQSLSPAEKGDLRHSDLLNYLLVVFLEEDTVSAIRAEFDEFHFRNSTQQVGRRDLTAFYIEFRGE